jgi:hypothetical protein
VFIVVCALCVAGAAGYAVYAAWHARAAAPTIVSIPIERLEAAPPATTPTKSDAGSTARTPDPSLKGQTERPVSAAAAAGPTGATASPQRANGPVRPYLLFRSTALGQTYGRVSLAYLDARDDQRYVSPLRCDRVHFAVNHGLCLRADRGVVTTYRALIFDREFRVLHAFPLGGVPSRARISPDGRLAAMTVFVSGHSYAESGFSTRTSVVEAATGRVLVEDLEELRVVRDGVAFKASDFNFWGVTFARDGTRFYATLATSGQFYLIEGDLTARQVRLLHKGVECPSLSPDNTRVAFKRRVGLGDRLGRFAWRLYVLDLSTLEETALTGETRNVDDQVEWLDDNHIVYALPDDVPHATAATNSWVLSSDGRGAPELLMSLAFSPAVVR